MKSAILNFFGSKFSHKNAVLRVLLAWCIVLATMPASAELNICPRMPIATAVSNQFLTSISASGATTLAQPAFTNLSGSVAASQMPALTGDITTSAGAVATTLATVNSNVGSFGDSTHVGAFTVNAKGLITAASSVSIVGGSSTSAPPSVQSFTSSTGTYNKNYTFIITSGSATVGATYTNNAVTFTVWRTVASAVQVVMNGSGAPAASGTLTKASGTGDSTLTFSSVLAPLYLQVRMVGGGGAGPGGGSGFGTGTAGGNTTFGSSLLTANGGGNSGGAGGSATISTGAYGTAFTGSAGGNGAGLINAMGGSGGPSCFGGAGSAGANSGSGGSAPANSGGGGGAAGATGAAGSSAGGAAGGCITAIIAPVSATYAWAVGTGGTGGTAGTAGGTGGNGGSGYIEVTEYYQ